MTDRVAATSSPAVRRSASAGRILGIFLILLGLTIAVGSEYQIREISRWARDMQATEAYRTDPATERRVFYHNVRANELRATRWGLFGHATTGIASVAVGLLVLLRAWPRPAAPAPRE